MKIHTLDANTINDLPAGEHADGLGLYLIAQPTGGRSWMFKFTWAGKKQKMGLGSATMVSLDEARSQVFDFRKMILAGINPKVSRQAKPAQRTSPNFADYAREVVKLKTKGMTAKGADGWIRSIEDHAKPLHKMEIATISRLDIQACLEPIWLTIPASAANLRGRLKIVFDHARSNYVLPDDHQNPADWTMLQHLLPKQPKPGSVRGSHACLPYVELPAFWERLKAFGTTSAQTLQFLILTCMRSGEVLQTRWEQLDLEEVGEWLVPASVMKNGLPANVPLSSEAIELLRGIRNAQQAAGYDTTKGLVFRGQDPSKQQGQDTMLKLLKDSLGYADTTVHGFRATFKTWAGEKTSHDRDTQEYCLHHITGDAAEQAYKRGEFWDKRQACLQDWADVVTGLTPITPVKRKLQRKAPALSLVA